MGRNQIDPPEGFVLDEPASATTTAPPEGFVLDEPDFDPEGSGFDMRTALASGDTGDEQGHFGSIDPRTGMVLKGMKHETIQKTLDAERALGNVIVRRDGRFFSVPSGDTWDYVLGGGKIDEIAPITTAGPYRRFRDTLKNKAVFDDTIGTQLYLAALTSEQPGVFTAGKDYWTRKMFGKTMSPSEVMGRAVANDKFIKGYTSSWNEMMESRRPRDNALSRIMYASARKKGFLPRPRKGLYQAMDDATNTLVNQGARLAVFGTRLAADFLTRQGDKPARPLLPSVDAWAAKNAKKLAEWSNKAALGMDDYARNHPDEGMWFTPGNGYFDNLMEVISSPEIVIQGLIESAPIVIAGTAAHTVGAPTALVGKLRAITAMGLPIAADTYQDVRHRFPKQDPWLALGQSLLTGLGEGVIEEWTLGKKLGILENAPEIFGSVGAVLFEGAKAFSRGTAEETAQQFQQNFWQWLFTDRKQEWSEGVAQAAALGGPLELAMSGGFATAGLTGDGVQRLFYPKEEQVKLVDLLRRGIENNGNLTESEKSEMFQVLDNLGSEIEDGVYENVEESLDAMTDEDAAPIRTAINKSVLSQKVAEVDAILAEPKADNIDEGLKVQELEDLDAEIETLKDLNSKTLPQIHKIARAMGLKLPKGTTKTGAIRLLAGIQNMDRIQQVGSKFQVRRTIADNAAGRGVEITDFDSFGEALASAEAAEDSESIGLEAKAAQEVAPKPVEPKVDRQTALQAELTEIDAELGELPATERISELAARRVQVATELAEPAAPSDSAVDLFPAAVEAGNVTPAVADRAKDFDALVKKEGLNVTYEFGGDPQVLDPADPTDRKAIKESLGKTDKEIDNAIARGTKYVIAGRESARIDTRGEQRGSHIEIWNSADASDVFEEITHAVQRKQGQRGVLAIEALEATATQIGLRLGLGEKVDVGKEVKQSKPTAAKKVEKDAIVAALEDVLLEKSKRKSEGLGTLQDDAVGDEPVSLDKKDIPLLSVKEVPDTPVSPLMQSVIEEIAQVSQSIGAAKIGFASFDKQVKLAQQKASETGQDWYMSQRASKTGPKWIVQDTIPEVDNYTIVRPDGTAEFIKQASLTADEAFDFTEKLKRPPITDRVEAFRQQIRDKNDSVESLQKELRSFIFRSLPVSRERDQAFGLLARIRTRSWDTTNIKNFEAAVAYVGFAAELLRKQQAVANFKELMAKVRKDFGTKKSTFGKMRPEFRKLAEPLEVAIEGIDEAKLSSRKRNDILGLQRKINKVADQLVKANIDLMKPDPDLLNPTVRELLKIPDARLEQLRRLSTKALVDMKAEEIEILGDEVMRVVSQNNLKNSIIIKNRAESNEATLDEMVSEMIPSKRAVAGEKPSRAGALGRYTNQAGKTIATSLQETTGSLENTTAQILLWDILEGLGDRYSMERRVKLEVQNRLDAIGVSFETVKKWRETEHTFEKVRDVRGRPITMNEAQLLSVLMDLRNGDNRNAAMKGYKWRQKKGQRTELVETGPLGLQELGRLVEPLTDLHKKAADIGTFVLDEMTKPELNKTSVTLFAHEMFRIVKYWAINRVLPLALGGARDAVKPLSERGMVHERQGGAQEIWLTPFFSKLHNSIEESTAYAHMMIPIFNAKSILASKDWQQAMERSGRLDEMDQIINKFVNLERAATTKDALELWGSGLLRGFGRAKLSLNLGSVLAQLTSDPMLGSVDFARWARNTLFNPSAALQAEIDEHSGLLWKRHSSARFSRDIGDIRAPDAVDEFFFDHKSLLNKPMQLQGWTDMMVTQKAWKMAKSFVDDTAVNIDSLEAIDKDTEVYWEQVRRRVNELMMTQPQWEVYMRSELLASSSFTTKNLFAFHSPVEAMWNVVQRANADVTNKVPGARERQAQAYGAVGASLVAYRLTKYAYYGALAAIPALFMGKVPDDEKKRAATMPERLLYDFMNLAPAGKIVVPLVETLVAGVAGRRLPRNALEKTPIASIAVQAGFAAFFTGKGFRNLAIGEDAAGNFADAAKAALDVAAAMKGVPLTAAQSAVKPWFDEREDAVDEFLRNYNKPIKKGK